MTNYEMAKKLVHSGKAGEIYDRLCDILDDHYERVWKYYGITFENSKEMINTGDIYYTIDIGRNLWCLQWYWNKLHLFDEYRSFSALPYKLNGNFAEMLVPEYEFISDDHVPTGYLANI